MSRIKICEFCGDKLLDFQLRKFRLLYKRTRPPAHVGCIAIKKEEPGVGVHDSA